MSNAIFLELADAMGEATDKNHIDWIRLESINWGISNTATMVTGSGTSAGQCVPQSVAVTKFIDSATPVIIKKCAQGGIFATGVIEVMRSAEEGDDVVALKVTLHDAYISDYNVSDGAGSQSIPMESLSLNFSKIELEYTKQEKGSVGGETIPVSYDVLLNEAA